MEEQKKITDRDAAGKQKGLTIAVDLTALGDRMSGLERYAYRITEALIRLERSARFILVVRNEVPALLRDWRRFPKVSFCVIKGNNKLFLNQVRLPAVMKKLKADRYLFPAFPVPLLFSHPYTYGLIADMACFECAETMKYRSALFFRKGYEHTARTCRKVITISEFSKSRILSRFRYSQEGYPKIIEEKDILVAPCAAEEGAKRPDDSVIEKVREKYGLPEKYWLCLCTMEPRKNLPMLLQAYRELIEEGEWLPPLVLAGRDGWKNGKLYEEIRKLEETERESGDQVLYTKCLYRIGTVPDADLPAIYGGADCFIFPSKYEGFGMPPLEAQSYSVRKVLVPRESVFIEVMGGTAFYYQNNLKDLKKALLQARVWQGCSETKIRNNLSRFSWSRSARYIWGAMQ